MTRDEAVASIKVKLGFRTTLDAAIVTALQEEQELLERGKILPLFLKCIPQTMTLTAATELVTFPTGFLREHPEESMFFLDPEDDDKPKELTKDALGFLPNKYKYT